MLSAILLAILDGSHYQKLHKWLPLLLYLGQRLATELNTTMFGQSSMSTCWSSCQPYWMKTYIQKMTKLFFFLAPSFKMEIRNKSQGPVGVCQQWRIQNLPDVGAPTPKLDVKSYYLANFQ